MEYEENLKRNDPYVHLKKAENLRKKTEKLSQEVLDKLVKKIERDVDDLQERLSTWMKGNTGLVDYDKLENNIGLESSRTIQRDLLDEFNCNDNKRERTLDFSSMTFKPVVQRLTVEDRVKKMITEDRASRVYFSRLRDTSKSHQYARSPSSSLNRSRLSAGHQRSTPQGNGNKQYYTKKHFLKKPKYKNLYKNSRGFRNSNMLNTSDGYNSFLKGGLKKLRRKIGGIGKLSTSYNEVGREKLTSLDPYRLNPSYNNMQFRGKINRLKQDLSWFLRSNGNY